MPTPRTTCSTTTAGAVVLALFAAIVGTCGGDARLDTAPPRLADTGLFADPASRTIAADALPFEPQYPLWTDGAVKSRWMSLPAGTSIDASDVDHWEFPIGTRLWKEFDFASGGVETRFMPRRSDGTWLYATYVRTKDGGDVLAPDAGVRAYCATTEG